MSTMKQIEAFSRFLSSSVSRTLLSRRLEKPHPLDSCLSSFFLPQLKSSYVNPTLYLPMHAANLNGSCLSLRSFSTSTTPLKPPNNRTEDQTSTPSLDAAHISFDQEILEEGLKQNINSERRLQRYFFLGAGCFAFIMYFISQLKEVDFWFYSLVTDFMCRWVDPERAHRWVIWLAGHDLLPIDVYKDDSAMRVTIKGLEFPNPIGLAAGFDKNAEGPLSFLKLGFGFVEIGTVTPLPQEGNPKPRIFRLNEDRAVINRCGFNGVLLHIFSDGVDVVEERLKHISTERWKNGLTLRNIIGVNVGKNKTTPIAANDIQYALEHLGRYGDYVVINVSSPNTPGLRDLQAKAALTNLIETAQATLDALETSSSSSPSSSSSLSSSSSSLSSSSPSSSSSLSSSSPSSSSSLSSSSSSLSSSSSSLSSSSSSSSSTSSPKVYKRRLLTEEEVQKEYLLHKKKTQEKYSFSTFPNQQHGRPLLFIKVAVLEKKVDGLIVSNTTISRPSTLSNSSKEEIGGLSGVPLKELATTCVADFYKLTNGNIPIIACGGVETGADALEKVEAGASYHSLQSAVGHKFKHKTKRVKAPTFD
ncbi:putative dihydroorotate dehydrogenase reveal [Cardiosporidium cionae]|uniref:Dihydroorotate dehydrogenase (quinone), mitochondrial n=1 Tax=Cardiosporidium cionae TaxID=476202 RepID=A0ABQ7J4M3_9APIC|nr:putative dihydroorotate dehydrogenase reveal [Cardiosporidium cionae]|eukprot:KAF8817945.1 putative dihydroorotate dehydrogenase reveal [Cardiosporidium cionae]